MGSAAPLLHVNRLNKTESCYFRFFGVFLVSMYLYSDLISSLQLVLCRVATVRRFPVHHQSADYIYSGPLNSLGSI